MSLTLGATGRGRLPIIGWRAKVLPQWSRESRSQAQAPVQTRLADLSPTMRDTVLVNVGCLVASRWRPPMPGCSPANWTRPG